MDGGPPPSVVTYITVGGVLLLDQLLGALDLVQGNALGRASRLADPLGVRFPLSFTLFVARRWHEGSVEKYDRKKKRERIARISYLGLKGEHGVVSYSTRHSEHSVVFILFAHSCGRSLTKWR